jgi:hypothetical protein
VNIRAAAAVFVMLVPSLASGHEIGTTNVRLNSDRAGHWIATITTAPRALLNTLEAEAGEPRTPDVDASTLRRHLEPRLGQIASHLGLRFDGIPCRPLVAIDTLEVPADVTRPSYVALSASCDAATTPSTITWRDDLVYSTYAVVLEHDRRTQTVWVEGDATASLSLQSDAASGARPAIVWQYLRLGFEHILPRGLDHILFVLGMFLLTRSVRPILVQVTSFTLAHSLTLGLTMYGVVSLPSSVVEPLIAISIAYVAIENILMDRIAPWRPVVVFGFGLLHGMGFAGVLRDLHLPRASFVPALVSFNLGVELAQLTVIALAFACTRAVWQRGGQQWYRARVVVPASAAIALTALVWTVERVAGY